MQAYYFLFILIVALGLMPINKKIKIFFTILILSLFAGSRGNIDNDYHIYHYSFKFISTSIAEFNDDFKMEPCMYIITNFSRLLFSTNEDVINFSFLIFAFLGVSTKVIAISKSTSHYFLALIFYFTSLFFIQEMTTIRAGVAAGIFLLAIPDIINKKYWRFFIKLFFCFMFHNSSVIFLMVFLVLIFLKNIRYYYISMIITFLLLVAKVDIVSLLKLDVIFPRVAIYVEVMNWQNEEEINIFNFRIILSILLLVFFAFNYRKHIKQNPLFDTLFKIHIISLTLFFALSLSAATFSLRSFELLSVCQILLYPIIIDVRRPKFKIVGYVSIIIVCIFQFYYMVEISEIFKPYITWL